MNHILSVIRKILSPNNAYRKFVFKDGKPTMSAILTTSSINMAKRYYKAIKEFTSDKNWIETQFPNQPLRQGTVMNDPDFPRVAITYSLEENTKDSAEKEAEMAEIIAEYNKMFGTSWSVESINRYNGDINNRLARKKGEFKEFGKHLDLVIVVDRLLTGFDAPRCQTLFVDRNLQYAGLIQAFSRTNRTYKGKDKGLITTFRKPATMKEHVYAATRLYSQTNNNSSLIYPTYEESKKKFNAAYTALVKLDAVNPNNPITEHDPISDRINFVKCFQDLNKAYRAIASYDEFNIELDSDKNGTFTKKIAIIEDDKITRLELSKLLNSHGYETVLLTDFENLSEESKKYSFDLILLDINLPYENGYEICRKMKKLMSVPIIFVTSRDTSADELLSIQAGGIDFITKPYDTLILLEKIKRALQLSNPNNFRELTKKDCTLDLHLSVLKYEGKSIELTRNEFRILYYFFMNEDKIISKEELLEKLWNDKYYLDENVLLVNMTRLKKKMKEIGIIHLLENIRGKGWKL